ncbi:MAG: hypothetical protein MUE81_00610 [Thermoflexibacter sp.]|jgi:hypothetical protein|nr:hypothetical protein [Thermoflexibacter sp.]
MEVQDLKIRTGKQQSFVRELEQLCVKYTSEEDFDFEAYTDEDNEEILIISNLHLNTTQEKAFLKDLEDLVKSFEVPINRAIEFEEIEANEFFEIYEFYIRTAKQEEFVGQLEKLCDQFSYEYDFEEYIDEEDEDIIYLEDFFIATEKPLEFIHSLELLCKQYATEDEFGFGFDAEES